MTWSFRQTIGILFRAQTRLESSSGTSRIQTLRQTWVLQLLMQTTSRELATSTSKLFWARPLMALSKFGTWETQKKPSVPSKCRTLSKIFVAEIKGSLSLRTETRSLSSKLQSRVLSSSDPAFSLSKSLHRESGMMQRETGWLLAVLTSNLSSSMWQTTILSQFATRLRSQVRSTLLTFQLMETILPWASTMDH